MAYPQLVQLIATPGQEFWVQPTEIASVAAVEGEPEQTAIRLRGYTKAFHIDGRPAEWATKIDRKLDRHA